MFKEFKEFAMRGNVIDLAVGFIIGGFSRQEGQPDIGKFTLTLQKGSSGRWLIFSDMDNGNRPASAPGP